MKKIKKKYVGKVKKGLLARCPTCKAKGFTGNLLVVREYKETTRDKKEFIRKEYSMKKIECKECNGKGVILWIDRILRNGKNSV